jgi:hypothetical protein
MEVRFGQDAAYTAGRAAHEIGLAAILGGNLFARVGMHPALREVSDPRERGRVVNAAWRRYGTVNSLALAALLGGWGASRSREPDRTTLAERERALVAARDAAVIAVAATGIVAGVRGVFFSRMEPEGAIPLENGSEPAADASPGESRAKRRLSVIGSLHLVSALALAGIDAALGPTRLEPQRRRGPGWRRWRAPGR